jgi:hypothetical protein
MMPGFFEAAELATIVDKIVRKNFGRQVRFLEILPAENISDIY